MRQNIVITSAGRRGKLVAIYRRELARLLPGAKLYAADTRPELSAACQMADGRFRVPPVSDSDYAERLAELCDEHGIGLIVPTIDTELLVLAERREAFAAHDIQCVVSDREFVRICRDKRRTAPWFVERGLQAPREVNPRATVQYPIFAKPFDGSCSHNVRVIASEAELTPALVNDPAMMFVEYLSPAEHDEYTLDMYYTQGGQLRCLVPRQRLETRAGEVSKGATRRPAALEPLRREFAEVRGARGCITVQVFIRRNTSEVFGVEINPRFGGGYPLSYEAGANFPRWMLEEYLLGQRVEFFDGWENDLTMLRFDEHVVVRGAAA